MRFAEGEHVRWTSQAQGYYTEKTGVVLLVVPWGWKPRKDKIIEACLGKYGKEPRFVTDLGGLPRDHESYIVAIPPEGKKRPAVYWPRTSALGRAG